MPAKKGDDPAKGDAKLKDRRKSEQGEGDKKSEKEKEDENDVREKIKRLSSNPNFQKAFYFAIVLLFVAALILIILYFMKLKDVTEKERATTRIITFMGTQNVSFKGMESIPAFQGAEEILENVGFFYLRNEAVLMSIDGLYDLFRKGWASFGGYMYEHNENERFENARKICIKKNLSLPEIYSLEEQEFLINQVFRVDRGTWIGLRRADAKSKWMWLSGREPKVSYMDDLEASYAAERDCVNLHVCKQEKKPRCWHPISCSQSRAFFCRMKPDPRWLQKGSLRNPAISVQAKEVY